MTEQKKAIRISLLLPQAVSNNTNKYIQSDLSEPPYDQYLYLE